MLLNVAANDLSYNENGAIGPKGNAQSQLFSKSLFLKRNVSEIIIYV